MKVLQIINSLETGGAEKLILDSIPLYQNKGVSTDLILLCDKDSQFRNQLNIKSNGKIDGLTLKSIYNPLLIFKIMPYLKQYDIVHMHLFPTLYWVVIAKLFSFSKVKLIYTEHSTRNRRRSHPIFKQIDKFIYNRLDAITAITIGVKKELIKHLNSEIKIEVINNGINVSAFNLQYAKDYNYFTTNDFKIIQVSSFREQKDQATIIRSLPFLSEKIKLILVGNGYLIEKNKALAKELGVSDRIKFLGNRYDIPELMNYADLVVLSSHWEGFGLAVLEGMAAGKPAIASDIEGVREIVEGYGLLFKQGDEKDLAKHINSLIIDEEFYKNVAIQCFNRAKEFDISIMVDKFIQLYWKVITKQ